MAGKYTGFDKLAKTSAYQATPDQLDRTRAWKKKTLRRAQRNSPTAGRWTSKSENRAQALPQGLRNGVPGENDNYKYRA